MEIDQYQLIQGDLIGKNRLARNTNAPHCTPVMNMAQDTQNHQHTEPLAQVIKDLLQYNIDKDMNQIDNEGHLKNVIKLNNEVKTTLTIKGLRQEGLKGLKFLNQYIQEVEQTCPYNPIRVALLPYTAESGLLKRLKLDDMNALNQLSWAEVKQILMKYLPEVGPIEAERQLLTMSLTYEDDVEEFASGVMNGYSDICQLLNIEQLYHTS